MTNYKRLKDPIYGYISIDSSIIEGIIDTAEFQRLRGVIQTSYAPLYSSAVHNRFVHSLGVYYLGGLAKKSIESTFPADEKADIPAFDRFLHIFEIACLLHDLGHAPFSHTGENFYLENGSREILHSQIIELTKDEDLREEIPSRNYKAAAHELMSVVVSLKAFKSLFENDSERSFFARCILGYPFFLKKDKEHSWMNCVISLLNSSVIDVDKLDYLIRDAYITGFDTVAIDYKRLLSSIRLVKDEGQNYKLVYKKGAISVIENVVYAHDAERKWIQTHPVVQYEAYLLGKIMGELQQKYEETSLFSYEALTREGISIKSGMKVSLMSDADIVFLMKNLENNEEVNEYFCRQTRRHPLWKSESEYKAIFSQGYNDEIFTIVERRLDEVCKWCKSYLINEEALKGCKEDIKKSEQLADRYPGRREEYLGNVKVKKKNIEWINALKEFAESQKIPFDFVVVNTKQFTSGFTKSAFSQIEIDFDSLSKPCVFSKVTNVLNAKESERESFFYLYYRVDKPRKPIDVNRLAVELGKVALKEKADSMEANFTK